MNGDYHGHLFYSHNGATIGHSSYISVFPNDGVSIGLMTNNQGVNFVSYMLLFNQILDVVLGAGYDNSTTCAFSTGQILFPKTYPSATIQNREKYVGSFYNEVYGYIDIYPAENNELYLDLGYLHGKLRPNGNNFSWYTENSFEGDSLTFTFNFNPSGQKAKSPRKEETKNPKRNRRKIREKTRGGERRAGHKHN